MVNAVGGCDVPALPSQKDRRIKQLSKDIRGAGFNAECPKCVASKFACDAHFVTVGSPVHYKWTESDREELKAVLDEAFKK